MAGGEERGEFEERVAGECASESKGGEEGQEALRQRRSSEQRAVSSAVRCSAVQCSGCVGADRQRVESTTERQGQSAAAVTEGQEDEEREAERETIGGSAGGG